MPLSNKMNVTKPTLAQELKCHQYCFINSFVPSFIPVLPSLPPWNSNHSPEFLLSGNFYITIKKFYKKYMYSYILYSLHLLVFKLYKKPVSYCMLLRLALSITLSLRSFSLLTKLQNSPFILSIDIWVTTELPWIFSRVLLCT